MDPHHNENHISANSNTYAKAISYDANGVSRGGLVVNNIVSNPVSSGVAAVGIVAVGAVVAGPVAVAYSAEALSGLVMAQQGQRIGSAVIGGAFNAAVQMATLQDVEKFDGSKVAVAAGTAYISSGMGLLGSLGVNVTGEVGLKIMKGKDVLGKDFSETATDVAFSAAGTVIGFKLGDKIKSGLDPIFNPVSKLYKTRPASVYLDGSKVPIILEEGLPSSIVPSLAGNAGESVSSEIVDRIRKLYL